MDIVTKLDGEHKHTQNYIYIYIYIYIERERERERGLDGKQSERESERIGWQRV